MIIQISRSATDGKWSGSIDELRLLKVRSGYGKLYSRCINILKARTYERV